MTDPRWPSDAVVEAAGRAYATAMGNDTWDIEAITAALIAADRAAWMPIETAPTNISILIWVPRSEHYGPGIWRAIHVDMGTGKHWLSTGLHVGRDLGEPYRPTMWRPLPTTPGHGEHQ